VIEVLLPSAMSAAIVLIPSVMVVVLVALIVVLSVRKTRQRREDEARGISWTQEPDRPFRRRREP
jgi:heme/copper-type cytochrome/quinol oxidase subunit 2